MDQSNDADLPPLPTKFYSLLNTEATLFSPFNVAGHVVMRQVTASHFMRYEFCSDQQRDPLLGFKSTVHGPHGNTISTICLRDFTKTSIPSRHPWHDHFFVAMYCSPYDRSSSLRCHTASITDRDHTFAAPSTTVPLVSSCPLVRLTKPHALCSTSWSSSLPSKCLPPLIPFMLP